MKIAPKQYAVSFYESTANVSGVELEKRIKNFVEMLKKNNDLSLSEKIIDQYEKHYRSKKNISKIELISGGKMDSGILQKILKKFKKQIEIEEKIDESLMGGVIIRIDDDVLIDGSIKRKLEILKRNLN